MSRRASYRSAATAAAAVTGPVNQPVRNIVASDAWGTSDYLLVLGTPSANVTLTLPASPSVGDQYGVKVSGTLGVNVLTIAGNGNQVETPGTLGTFAGSVTMILLSLVNFRWTGAKWVVA